MTETRLNQQDAGISGGVRKPLPPEAAPSVILWLLIIAAVLVGIGVYLLTGIGPGLDALKTMIVIGGGLSAGYCFALWRRLEREALVLRSLGELTIVTVTIGLLSYAGSAMAMPLRDSWFHSWDQALGFDWMYWLGVLNDRPTLHRVLAFVYHTMLWQSFGLVILLGVFLRYRALKQFLVAYLLCAVATVAIATAIPAMSPLVHFGLTPADYPNIQLAVSLEFQEHALAMRDGSMRLIDLGGAQGLVTFPSFHTVSAVLLAIGFWQIPYVRWPALALNALMLISIPIEGSHYLVDVLAGVVVAIGGWALAGALLRFEGPARRVLSNAGALVRGGRVAA